MCALVLDQTLVCIWLRGNVGDRLFDCDREISMLSNLIHGDVCTAVDGIGLLVRNLNAELFFDGHDYLYCVQAV